MKRLLAALAAILFAASVHAQAADTLTITVVSDVPGQTGTATKTWTLSQSDMATFLSWVNSAYPCSPTPCTQNTMTALGQWAGGFVSGTVANVTSWQKGNAAATAAAGVTPVNPQ